MRQRAIIGIIATALTATVFVFGFRALQSAYSTAAQPRVNVAARQQEPDVMKIVPATVEGSGGRFFVGTGDGGNGAYTK